MTENRVRVVAEYCPSCGGVHYPPAEKLGTGMLCTTCRYWQIDWSQLPEQCDECETRGVNCSLHSGPEWLDDRGVVSDSPSPSEEGRPWTRRDG